MSGPIGKISTEGNIIFIDVEKGLGGITHRVDLPKDVSREILDILKKSVDSIKEEIIRKQYQVTIDNAIK